MSYSDKQFSDKLANIKSVLEELGNCLESEEPGINLGIHYKTTDAFTNPPKKKEYQAKEKPDLDILIAYERERNSALEKRILNKDALLTEMNILQNELYANIEELQNKTYMLKSDLEYSQLKITDQAKEIKKFSLLVQRKDLEISKLLQEREKLINQLSETKENKFFGKFFINDADKKTLTTEAI